MEARYQLRQSPLRRPASVPSQAERDHEILARVAERVANRIPRARTARRRCTPRSASSRRCGAGRAGSSRSCAGRRTPPGLGRDPDQPADAHPPRQTVRHHDHRGAVGGRLGDLGQGVSRPAPPPRRRVSPVADRRTSSPAKQPTRPARDRPQRPRPRSAPPRTRRGSPAAAGSVSTARPVSAASGAARSRYARERSLDVRCRSGPKPASTGAVCSACAPTDASSSGMSAWPWNRSGRRSTRSGRAARRPAGPPSSTHVHAELDLRAVLPQPLERVELPLLGVLDVHHQVEVVQQHPALLPVPLAADRLGVQTRAAPPRPRRPRRRPGVRWTRSPPGTRR